MAEFLQGYRHSNDIFEVEKIVDCEMRHGRYVYRVRWKGCPREEDTWEPEDNLLTCDDLLKTFKEDREEKRRKRKLKKKERRSELIRSATPLSIKIKEESGSDSDEAQIPAEKKRKPSSSLTSPNSDMDDFDLSGLTRKQRHEIEKVIEESRKDAELASPTSSTTDETNQQGNHPMFNTKKSNESCAESTIYKKKKKQRVIEDSSDSEDFIVEPRQDNHKNKRRNDTTTKKNTNATTTTTPTTNISSSSNDDDDGDDDADNFDDDDKDDNKNKNNKNNYSNNTNSSSSSSSSSNGNNNNNNDDDDDDDNNKNNNIDDSNSNKNNNKNSSNEDVTSASHSSKDSCSTSHGEKMITFEKIKLCVSPDVSVEEVTSRRASVCESIEDNESLANDKGKKPSEILGKIFAIPKNTVPVSNLLIESNRFNSIIANSPINISDDSNDENGIEKSSLKPNVRIDTEYVPLLAQLQQKCEPTMSLTSIDLTDKLTAAKVSRKPCNEYYHTNVFDNSKLTVVNESNENSESSVVNKINAISNPVANVLTGIPSSSTLKLDIGKNKQTYMKGVENIRNMLMSANANDKKRREIASNLNISSESVIAERVIEEKENLVKTNSAEPLKRSLSENGNLRRVRQVISSINISGVKDVQRNNREDPLSMPAAKDEVQPVKSNQPTETIHFEKANVNNSISPVCYYNEAHVPLRSSTNEIAISHSLSTTQKKSNDEKDANKKHVSHQVISLSENSEITSPVMLTLDTKRSQVNNNRQARTSCSNEQEAKTKNHATSIHSNEDFNMQTDTTNANIIVNSPVKTKEINPVLKKIVDLRINTAPTDHTTSKTPHRRIPLYKSFSSPGVPNTMKISRSEKLLNEMKSATAQEKNKRAEKCKKLSLKEYNAKKASKQNVAPPQPAIFEFTKIPTVHATLNTAPTQKLLPVKSTTTTTTTATTATDKVIVIPPAHLPKGALNRQVERREKVAKTIQMPTTTDVLGNIMECFKQPYGRDSTVIATHNEQERGEEGNQDAVAMDTEDSDIETDLDEYSGDEDGLLRTSMENAPKPSHLNLPHANTKYMDVLSIYQAMLRGDIDALIRCNIPADQINTFVDQADTLLMKAVVLKSFSTAQILLEKNADPNILSKHGPRNGKSALMVAVELNQKSMVTLLVHNNACLNTQTENGETALIMASKLGRMDIIHVLLNSGADVKPAATYLEKKVSEVPANLRPELHSALHHHAEKLKEITEKFLKDVVNSQTTQLGQPLMPLRCVSPEESEESEFYFKCDINGVEPSVNIVLLALPVLFKGNGGIDVKFTDSGVKNVYLNDCHMFPTSPGGSLLYFLFPKCGRINSLRVKCSCACKHKLLLCVYTMTYTDRIDNTYNINRMLIQATSAPLPPVH